MSEKAVAAPVVANKYKKQSQWADVWRRLKRNKMAVIGLAIFILLCTMALTAPLFYDYDADIVSINVPNRLQSPNAEIGSVQTRWGAIFLPALFGAPECPFLSALHLLCLPL